MRAEGSSRGVWYCTACNTVHSQRRCGGSVAGGREELEEEEEEEEELEEEEEAQQQSESLLQCFSCGAFLELNFSIVESASGIDEKRILGNEVFNELLSCSI